MLFKSKLCKICQHTLDLAFTHIDNYSSPPTPHHPTKQSLINSTLQASCHLCRFLIYHFRATWAAQHQIGRDDLQEDPVIPFSPVDFSDSDFEYEGFPKGCMVLRSYMLELPEEIEYHVRVDRFLGEGGGEGGTLALVEFECHVEDRAFAKGAIARFWCFEERAFGEKPQISKVNGSTGDEECKNVLRTWMSICEGHEGCKFAIEGFVPSRLLDLSEVGNGKVRLVSSRDIGKSIQYATLSHCWGGNVPFQLRSHTIEMMQNGFDTSQLPKTFQDAVEVAGWAELKYIWIDSCCIMQDSLSDWSQEATLMQKVYQNSALNISASHSENSLRGCFADRLAYKITPVTYNTPVAEQYYLLPQFDMTNILTDALLSERAWVLQERCLAPRQVHFTADQLFWECTCLYACEAFPRGMPGVYDYETSRHYRSLPISPSTPKEQFALYKAWGRLCQDYSGCKLSFISDKLIAFAGVAKDFQLRLENDIYLAGIWKGDLIDGLLWRNFALDGRPMQANGSREEFADPYITASVPEKYRAPSWSWLSKDVRIFWQTYKRNVVRVMIDVLDVKVEYLREEETAGDIRGGHLKIRGCLRKARWYQVGEVDFVVFDGKRHEEIVSTSLDPEAAKANSFILQRDTDDHFPVDDIYCLPIRLSRSNKRASHNKPLIEGIILRSTENTGEYYRLGHFEALGEVCCGALMYTLRDTARELRFPWDRVNFDFESFEEYDQALFEVIEAQVITIV